MRMEFLWEEKQFSSLPSAAPKDSQVHCRCWTVAECMTDSQPRQVHPQGLQSMHEKTLPQPAPGVQSTEGRALGGSRWQHGTVVRASVGRQKGRHSAGASGDQGLKVEPAGHVASGRSPGLGGD